MTSLDDFDLWPESDDREPRPCRRHRWFTDPDRVIDGITMHMKCIRCGRVRDEATSRRGRTNRSRGNAIERQVGKALGLTRVGQYGSPTDLGSIAEPFAVQVKSGRSFPERLWVWLKGVPATANQTPLLVVTDAPGPGHRRRALVVLTLEDWISLHGTSGVAE